MKISVIIACRNEERTLAETLAGVAAQEWDQPWEVVFADNGSTDGSRAIFERFARERAEGRPDWRLIDASARPGKSYTLNLAMTAARAPAVLFCDADDVPAPGWLAAMAAALETHPFVGCRVELDRLNSGWVRGYRDYGANEARLGRTSYPPHAAYSSGNCLGMTKAVFHAVGRFDEETFALEDIDFCIRAQLAGFKLEFVPQAIMHVRFRDSLPGLAKQNYNYAKALVCLTKRYRKHQPRGWLRGRIRRNLAAWGRLVPEYYAVTFGPRKDDPVARAVHRWNRAGAAGKIVGMLRYRSLPP